MPKTKGQGIRPLISFNPLTSGQCEFTNPSERCGYCAKRNLPCSPKYPTPRKCAEAGIAVVVPPAGIALSQLQPETTQQPSVPFPQPPPALRVEIPELPPQYTLTSPTGDQDEDDELRSSPTPSPSPSPIISAGGYFMRSPATGLSPTASGFATLQISSPHLDPMTLHVPPSPIAGPFSPSGTTTPEYFSTPASPIIPSTEPLAINRSPAPRSPVPIPPPRHPAHTLASSNFGVIPLQSPNILEEVIDGQTYTEHEVWKDVENFCLEYNPCTQLFANFLKRGIPNSFVSFRFH